MEQAMYREWHGITDYEVPPAELEDNESRALSGVWIERKSTLGESAGSAEFMERLKREWAIETGLIERLYTLDRGITQLLIERGIDAALIPHHVAGNPEQVAAMILDQRDAVESVFAFVQRERTISTGYVKELHSLFTRNQRFAEGLDQFGNKSPVPLLRGDYKKQPNNPTRPDGTTHFYCPPEHVAAEMDQLIAWNTSHEGVAPEVEAAWLHHRFAQIHPFQDGNGRVARALATLIFIKADWLPLVVRDSERAKYIDALESADGGDLRPLVSFFAGLQRREFVKALGVTRDVEQTLRVDARVRSISERLAKRRDALEQEWQAAESSAKRLHEVAHQRLIEVRELLEKAVQGHDEFRFFVEDDDDQGSRSHHFKRQIVSTAKELDYYANTQHYRSWIRLVATNGSDSQILIAFHAMGHEFQGVLACSGTWFRRVQTDDDSRETEGETALSEEVFQINYKEDAQDIERRFEQWLEGVIERGLALWESTAL